jgi:tetratricopeptide (TPR) repeat protein
VDEAESIRAIPIDVLDGLQSLVDKSLLRQLSGGDEELRFGMFETVREYALERLDASNELAQLCQRHAAYYLSLAEAAEPELGGPQQEAWLDRLENEHDNLRAALGWSLDQGAAGIALRLSGALWRFWHIHGHLSEGRRWLEAALALANSGAPAAQHGSPNDQEREAILLLRVKVLIGAGRLALTQGDDERAHALYEEALALARMLGDRRDIATTLHWLGGLAGRMGDYERSDTLFEEGLTIFRELGDQRDIARLLSNRGVIALLQGDVAAAQTWLEESLTLRRTLGDTIGIMWSLANLGEVACRQGDSTEALARYRESLALSQKLRATEGMAVCLEGIAQVIATQGQTQPAARLWGAAEALRESIGAERQQAWRAHYEEMVAAARTNSSPATFDAAWASGRSLSLEEASAEASGISLPNTSR